MMVLIRLAAEVLVPSIVKEEVHQVLEVLVDIPLPCLVVVDSRTEAALLIAVPGTEYDYKEQGTFPSRTNSYMAAGFETWTVVAEGVPGVVEKASLSSLPARHRMLLQVSPLVQVRHCAPMIVRRAKRRRK